MKNNEGQYEISLYSGELTAIVVEQEINKLRVAFPKMTDTFFNLLSERIVANDFSDDRLKDAIGYVLDNFSYKELNVSDVIKYDKRVKLYSPDEATNIVLKGLASFEDFEKRIINGVLFRIKKSDLAKI